MGIYTKSVSSAAARAYYDMVEGAYVYDISSGSCAEAAGLQTGDIITGVGDYAVASVSDLQAALKNYKAGESAVLSVFRDGETIEIRITFDEKQPNSGAQQAQPGYGHGTLPGYGGNGGFNG